MKLSERILKIAASIEKESGFSDYHEYNDEEVLRSGTFQVGALEYQAFIMKKGRGEDKRFRGVLVVYAGGGWQNPEREWMSVWLEDPMEAGKQVIAVTKRRLGYEIKGFFDMLKRLRKTLAPFKKRKD